jgi:thioredoxin 1
VTSVLLIRDLTALDAALDHADREPILLFKHSPTCGVSAQAHEEIGDLVAGDPPPMPVYLISVRAHRDVSDAVTRRFGIRHESPQVLLVHHGEVLWHASHFRVSAAEIQAAVKRIGTAAGR